MTTKKKTKTAPKIATQKKRVGRPLGKAHDARTRERIQTSMLINRLQDNALGKVKPPMTATQVNSAIALINRTLPVLSATEIHDTRNQDDTEHMDDTTLYSIAGGKTK